jgi:hypothetical protein
MGYRSQVVLAVGKQVLPQFLVSMSKSPEARAMCFSHADRMIKDYDGDGAMCFYWSQIKWYDNYECVQTIVDFMDWCECEVIGEDGDGIGDGQGAEHFFRFVRTGEDNDDNVVRGHGYDDIYISRNIEF